MTMAKGIFTAIGTLLVVILILYLTYVVTKYIGRGVGMKTRSGCMRVRDQIMLGKDRSAAIVQIGTRFFLIGVAGAQISILSELEEEDLIPLQDPEVPEKAYPDFKELLDKIGKGKKKNGH